ncbi:SGNH/GDSL hydrolase family protein [Cohaesibacter celericrescens]|nr:DUF459 domain-containing protein [Cohaesibacter celericrescens]
MMFNSHTLKSRSVINVAVCVVSFLLISTPVWAEKTLQNGDVKEETKPHQPVTVAILGDSLAVGLHSGIVQVARDTENIKVKKYSRVNTGLVRYDRYNWTAAAQKISKKDNSNIYIMMFGANDLQSIREKSKRHHFQSEGWVKRYNERLDGIIKAVKKPDRKIYWVGLPIVGKSNFATGYKYLNDIFKKRANANGITYISSWDWFASESGTFQMSGKGADGKKKMLRAQDKVHFTPQGYLDLGRYVAKEISLLE